MNIINESDSLKTIGEQRVGMTIGNFDGFHRGHRKILETMLEYCRKHEMLLLLMTFIPHPRIALKGEKQFLINDYKHRRIFLEESGVDILYEVSFTSEFRGLSPEDFLNEYVSKKNNIECFFLGHDFTFGKDKKGGRTLLEEHCRNNNISFEMLDEFKQEQEGISSSHIRSLLKQGHIGKANKLLGREFFLEGSVIHGFARGRGMGVPTANLALKDDLLVPGRGVYSTKTLHRGEMYPSLTNIGFNPTFQSSGE